tara:strand:- start:1092 stop:1328 length:237 start_codon:yes stop_codon:yes gene_type:complete
MAVNELERDYLAMLHSCDIIENIIGKMKMTESTDEEKKNAVGGIIMSLEVEILDDKYAKKDLSRINAVIKTGRTYWKS